jgi:glutathione synthase/RimK-type ligase-like ATP-grasp enzyme
MLLSMNRDSLVWRPFEREAASSVFGGVEEHGQYDLINHTDCSYVRWFPNSEDITLDEYTRLDNAFRYLNYHTSGRLHINPISSFMSVHDKVEAFRIWKSHGIPTPVTFPFDSISGLRDGMEIHQLRPPILLRLNNRCAGQDSWLIHEEQDLYPTARLLLNSLSEEKKFGVKTKAFCSQFIETRSAGGLRSSYRIIVAGDRVITGYARLCTSEDWVAVTNKFTPSMWDEWVQQNEACHSFMEEHEDLLVRAVHVLGMNYQGVDVIKGEDGRFYFLEIQTTYDAGFIGAGPYVPTFYNPYNQELCSLIQENRQDLERRVPRYMYLWLDKHYHFWTCYSEVKRSLDRAASMV